MSEAPSLEDACNDGGRVLLLAGQYRNRGPSAQMITDWLGRGLAPLR